MTKAELIFFLLPFTDDIEIKILVDGNELNFEAKYHNNYYVKNPQKDAQIVLTPNVQIEGQPAVGLSRSNAGLGSAKGE